MVPVFLDAFPGSGHHFPRTSCFVNQFESGVFMAKSVFVSYHFRRDHEVARNLKAFFQPSGTCQGSPVFVENDVSAEGTPAIDREINRVMSGCDAALFVIGDDTHNSPWIDREAALAISKNLPLVAVRRPGSTGNLPPQLRDRTPLVEWKHAALTSAVNDALRQRDAPST
jgi:hypothetical protein